MSTLINWGTLQEHIHPNVTKALQNSFDDIEKRLTKLAVVAHPAASTTKTINTVTTVVAPSGFWSKPQSGVTVAMAAGTVVAWGEPAPSIIDPTRGEYVVMAAGYDGGGTLIPVRVTQTALAMTLKPDFDNTTVYWTAIARTQ